MDSTHGFVIDELRSTMTGWECDWGLAFSHRPVPSIGLYGFRWVSRRCDPGMGIVPDLARGDRIALGLDPVRQGAPLAAPRVPSSSSGRQPQMPRVAGRPLMRLTCRMRPLTGRARSRCSRRASSRSGSGPEPRSPHRARRADAPSERAQEPVRRSGRVLAASRGGPPEGPQHRTHGSQPHAPAKDDAARTRHSPPRSTGRSPPCAPAPSPRNAGAPAPSPAGRSCRTILSGKAVREPGNRLFLLNSIATRQRSGHRQSRGRGVSRKVVHQSLPG